MPFNIGLYIRVSTEEQVLRTEGSLDSQQHRLAGYVDIKNMQQPGWGVVIDKYIDEGLSAKDTNRPALQRLIKDLKKGRINTVLVTDLSRLSRSIRDFCALIDFFKETKAQFLSLKEQFDTTTAAGEMMLFNMINLAQFERRQISERVTLNFHSRALRGLRNGGATILGFKIDPTNKSTLFVNEDEAPLVEKIFRTYIEEGSIYSTAARLRDENIPFMGTIGSTWNTQTVKNILHNYSYIGMREVNKSNRKKNQSELKSHEKHQIVKASWPAIIEESTFYIVQKMLSDNNNSERLRLKNAKARVFMFSGISTCGECGRALVGSTGHGKKSCIRYYIHRPIEGKPVTCSVKRFRADEIETILENHLLHVINRKGYLDGIEKTIGQSIVSEKDALITQKNEAAKKVSQADNDIKKIIRLQMQAEDIALNGIYTEQLIELQNQRQKERETLDRCELELSDLIEPKKIRNNLQENITRLQMAWGKATPKMKKNLLRIVIEKLVFDEGNVRIFYRQVESRPDDANPTKENFHSNFSVVDMEEKRNARKMDVRHPPQKSERGQDDSSVVSCGLFLKPAHNSKVAGWYIGKNGCGNRI